MASVGIAEAERICLAWACERYALITPKVGHRQAFIHRQQCTLMEEYEGYPRPDQMHLIGSYVLCGAGCHKC
eukprot:6199666-Pleurochrysis_carterae.AAC.2